MTTVAQFDINSTFVVSGRGLVVAGRIISGTITIGDFIDVEFEDGSEHFEISGVDHILTSASNPDPYAYGLWIKGLTMDKAEKFRNRKIIQEQIEVRRAETLH
jgi:hypothetical protein